MIKLAPPADVKITYILTHNADDLDRVSRMEWRFLVNHARTEVGRALNQFFYGQRNP
jgi:hypothetical protein